jgi:hypothetical protein
MMPGWIRNRLSRLLVAVMAMLGLTPMMDPARTAHDPLILLMAELQQHAELAAEVAEHGHSHDDPADDERRTGHTHGHNPADHSHETPFAPLPGSVLRPLTITVLKPVERAVVPVRSNFPVERPPRLVSAV